MSIRMLPISTVFQKMRRLVRDVSKKVNKEVELVLIGEETEVDKNVIDSLADPLMHIIRNSIDHGIGTPEERIKAGKPEKGRIVLEARTTGSDVIVTVSDDGRGLQRDMILKKAREKGLLSKPESELSDKEVYSLIFLPGFSTKDSVTEFSGRGVGMDVVRRNINQIGGSVSIESEPGRGTTHIIRIPLTLTIVDGMIPSLICSSAAACSFDAVAMVDTKSEVFAIPVTIWPKDSAVFFAITVPVPTL